MLCSLDVRTDPDFPSSELGLCWEKTLLVWIPCGALWIWAPLYIFLLRRRHQKSLPWTTLTYTKVVISVLALLSIATEFTCSLAQKTEIISLAVTVAQIILFASHFLHLWLIHLGRRYGEYSSSILWVFWLLMILCGGPQFYTSICAAIYKFEWLPTVFIVNFIAQYLCSIVLFSATSVNDTPPNFKPAVESQYPSPVLTASFPSQLFYWWNSLLVWHGWRRPLTEHDLWDVHPDVSVKKVSHWWNSTFNGGSTSKETLVKDSNLWKFKDTKINRNSESNNVSLLRMLWRISRSTLLSSCLLYLIGETIQFLIPQFLSLLITFTIDQSQPAWTGYMYAVGLFFSTIFYSLFRQRAQYGVANLSSKICCTLMDAVYQKMLGLSNSARRKSTVGQIVNLMSIDAFIIGMATMTLCSFVMAPFCIIGSLTLLWQKLGPSVLAGVTVILLLIPFSTFISKKISEIESSTMGHKDKRVKLVNEIIGGIKVLKVNAWETFFVKEVETVRDKEIKLLKKASFLLSFNSFLLHYTPSLVTLITFSTYLLVSKDNILDAETAFVAISLFNIMKGAIASVPIVLNDCIKAKVSLGRMQRFLSSDNLDPFAVSCDIAAEYAVGIHGGSFCWDDTEEESESFQLKNIDFELLHGQLVAVIGPVGAGKSSLMSALLGEMKKETGKVTVNGDVAYVSQQAWLQNATLQENITWGLPYDERKFRQIVEACSLQQDLDMLPAGEHTEIGEKGINLSGGQKLRVSLARAVYNNADVYLLDDPLSAVDVHVGHHIFNEVIGPHGLLRKKTRLLVTHALTFLNVVDEVMVMKDGYIAEMGTYNHLMEHSKSFSQFILQHMSVNHQDEGDEDQLTEQSTGDTKIHPNRLTNTSKSWTSLSQEKPVNISEDHPTIANTHGRLPSTTLLNQDKDFDKTDCKYSSESKSLLLNVSIPTEGAETSEDNIQNASEVVVCKKDASPMNGKVTIGTKKEGKLMTKKTNKASKQVEEEVTETGKVGRRHYIVYARAMGTINIIVAFILIVLSQVTNAGGNAWLSLWSSSESETIQVNHLMENSTLDSDNYIYENCYDASSTNSSIRCEKQNLNSISSFMDRDMFLTGYGLFNLVQAFFLFVGTYLASISCLRASNTLHRRLLDTVVHLPMHFFDTNPSGRIINRFSKDVHILDGTLPDNVRGFTSNLAQVIVTMFVIASAMPIALICLIPILGLYYFLQVVSVPSSRQVRRIISILKTPIFSHFTESIQGAPVIRAFKKQSDFIAISLQRIESYQKANLINVSVNRWISVHLELLGSIISLAAAMLAVWSRGSISPGTVGLTLTYAVSTTLTLNFLVKLTAMLETNIVSVERINEYIQREQEASWIIDHQRPPQSWPDKGEIVFKKYQTRYRPGLDLVLKDLSCTFKPGEKVGIVGRTGAGKSSLALSLFRMIESVEGNITVDGIDISKIGLHDLRMNISIIPQDPVLFSGPLRRNLDPSGVHSDEEIWRSLGCSHMKEYVRTQSLGLQCIVDEGGSNFSVGQRQLVCLARALLRNTQVLVMDEATAAVDLDTDELIQTTIREQFQDCTLLTIAHRINTIMDSDRVLVMDQGQVAEFDTPSSLLRDPGSIFYSMAKDAGVIDK